jgi:hypothetical protein
MSGETHQKLLRLFFNPYFAVDFVTRIEKPIKTGGIADF